MNSATIALTSEQKAIIAEKMGLVSDELVLTSLTLISRKCIHINLVRMLNRLNVTVTPEIHTH